MMHPIELVKGLISGGMQAGAPLSQGPLALVPLFGGVEAPTYVLGAEAIDADLVAVEENGAGDVPNLVVKNLGDRPALFVEGEHLRGAKQDRVLNVSVLAAARHDTVIPVSCVERADGTTRVGVASHGAGSLAQHAPGEEASGGCRERPPQGVATLGPG